MATHYIHEYVADTTANALIKFNSASPDKPNTMAIGAVSGVLYNGRSSADPPVIQNFGINTQNLSKTIRLNSQTDTVTASGDLIGFQSKPRTEIAGTQSVYGCQISAQISDGIALSSSGSIIGGHIDVFLRGTAAGTIAGDVRGLQIELTTDDAGTRAITGNVSALRVRMAFSSGTITGKVSAFRVEKPEVQTGSKTYDALFELTSTVGTGATVAWHDTQTSATASGVIGVLINGNKRYITLTSGTPS
jgi:hypothetical protein